MVPAENNNGRLAREQGGSGLAWRGSDLVGSCRRQTHFHGVEVGLGLIPILLGLGRSQGLSGPGQALFFLAGLEKQNGAIHGDVAQNKREKVIKAFRRNASVIEAFRVRNNAVFQAGVSANSYALLLMPLTGVLGTFFVIVLASLGGWLALQGLVSVGTIVIVQPPLGVVAVLPRAPTTLAV